MSLYASGRKAIAICDVCGFEYKLHQLRKLTVNSVLTETKACRACWVPDQPQLQLGRYPIDDPEAIREPRIDTTYYVSGNNINGNPGGGSRIFEWGWAPVGGGFGQGEMTPNSLISYGEIGTVTVTTT